MTIAARRPGRARIALNKVKTYLSKPQNTILILLGIILTITTIAPMVTIFMDTITVHEARWIRGRPRTDRSTPPTTGKICLSAKRR